MHAPRVRRLLDALPGNVAFELPDGVRVGAAAPEARATIAFRSEETIARLLAAPSLLGFAEAFISSEVDIRGDVLVALEAAYAADSLAAAPAPAGKARLSDAAAVSYHYDLSNAFYALFLDPRMVYTCAYYRGPEASLDEAQEAKLDLVCRKLRLAPGDRLLDVGCGWGALTVWASERYGADALGVTLSRAQAEYASALLAAPGRAGRARVEYGDIRELGGEGQFDKIAAVGVIEHVGVANYPAYFERLHRLLRPGGLLLNHGITHPTPGRYSTGMTFLTRHVFPRAEFQRVGETVARMEDAGFRIDDVEALGGHYGRTTAEWLARLQRRAEEARALVGERSLRTWIAYLAAASVAFRAGWIDVHQVLGRRPDPSAPRRPETRDHLREYEESLRSSPRRLPPCSAGSRGPG
jgi:cyclopropane-fatty-acyl-phospholipid synthase